MRLPTPRLFSGLKSALRPAMPRLKVSAFWLLVLAWLFLLVWIWWKGPSWSLYDEQWLKPSVNRWLATAVWGFIALVWLTVRIMKRLQQLEKQQKQQREEAVDPLSVELNAQQRYLDRWLLRLQRHLDNRRFLWQLPWYMVLGPASSGKTSLLREGFPSDIIYRPEAVRGAEQHLYITPHVGKQAVIFDIDGSLCEQPDADVLHRRLWEHALGWLVEKRARQPLNGLILTLDLPDLLTADKRRREHLLQTLRSHLQDVRQHLHCQLPVKGLGIKAIQYQYGGQVYVKITGYASLRRILQGTRYKINSPQILELGIGKAGINGGILEGAKFCIWFSLAYRTVQLIFKSDHDVAAFIGNITMDIAKIIVTIFVTKILVAAGGALAAGAASVGFAVTLPIALGIVLIVGIGFGITYGLDYLDRKYHLTDKLISAIREGMRTQAEIEKWNFEHTSPFTYGLMNTHW